MTDQSPLTTAQVAAKLDTDPKTLRRFLRTPQSTVSNAGKGKRYEFTARDIAGLKKRFAKWVASQPAKRVAAPKVEKPATVKASRTSKPKADTKGAGEARAAALDAALKARGTHVSQN